MPPSPTKPIGRHRSGRFRAEDGSQTEPAPHTQPRSWHRWVGDGVRQVVVGASVHSTAQWCPATPVPSQGPVQ